MLKLLKILNVFFAFLLTLVTLSMIIVLPLSTKISNPETVKGWLRDSNIYENAVTNAVDLINFDDNSEDSTDTEDEKSLVETIEENGVFTVDEVKTALQNSLDPDVIQRQSEKFIDELYAFLQSDDQNFSISLDISELSDDFEREFRQLFSDKLSKLPTCTVADININNIDSDFNPLTSPCLPPNTNVSNEVDRFINEFTQGEGLFSEPITFNSEDAEDLDLTNVQRVYQAVDQLLAAYVSTILLLVFLIFLTARPRMHAFVSIGLIWSILGGLFTLLYTVAFSFRDLLDISYDFNGYTNIQNQALRSILSPLSLEAAHDITLTGVWLSLSALVIGLLLFFLGHYAQDWSLLKKIPRSHKSMTPSSPPVAPNNDAIDMPETAEAPTKKVEPAPEPPKVVIPQDVLPPEDVPKKKTSKKTIKKEEKE